MTYALLVPDARDTALPDAVRAVAAMIATVLAPYGVVRSDPLAMAAVDLDPETRGIVVEHTAFAGSVTPSSECADDVLVTLHSHYYLRPVGTDAAEVIADTLALVVPLVRAHRKHIEHAVDGMAVACRLQVFAAGVLTRGEGDTAQRYYGLSTTCELYLFVLEPST